MVVTHDVMHVSLWMVIADANMLYVIFAIKDLLFIHKIWSRGQVVEQV